jgi:carboxypeptidase Taq
MTKNIMPSYRKLLEKTKNITTLSSASAILHWDMETMMPPKGIKMRSLQLAMLSRIIHKMSTDAEIGRLLKEVTKHPEYGKLDQIQKRNLYLIKKHYDEQTKLPEELVAETAKQQAITIDTWKKAKAAKDFLKFKPELEKLFNLKKQAAEILMKVKETSTPYDAMIDIFEPKMTSESISKVFKELREGLISLLRKCEESPKQPDISILKRAVPIGTQKKIGKLLADCIGYDIKSAKSGGRIPSQQDTTTMCESPHITTKTSSLPQSSPSSMRGVMPCTSRT